MLANKTGLTIRFVIPRKSFCSCIQKIKNKHDGDADVVFLFLWVTHSLMERLTVLVGNKDRRPENEEA